VALRQEFELYANVRPVKSIVPGGRYTDVARHHPEVARATDLGDVP